MNIAESRFKNLIIEPIKSNLGFMKHHITGVGKGVSDTLTFLSNEKNNPLGKFLVSPRWLEKVDNALTSCQHTYT